MESPSWLQYGVPSLDRPFGIAIWPIFSRAYYSFTGDVPQHFRFKPGQTPMASLSVTLITLASYYLTIFGGREVMKHQVPLKLKTLFKVHNLCLTIISGMLLVLFVEQLVPTVVRGGIFHSICDYDGGWTDQLVVLYYFNYLTKYLELLDTVFLFLRKKPLTFLHTYHHGATAMLCFTQLMGSTAVSWVPIVLNLMVHVVMYWYYFQAARGINVWWKKYITMLQIIQFVIDVGFVYFASYTYFSAKYFPSLPTAGVCAGEEFAAFAGMGILSSYLVLFIGFYLTTYKKPAKKAPTEAALDEMRKEELPDAKDVQEQLNESGATTSRHEITAARRGHWGGVWKEESTPPAGMN